MKYPKLIPPKLCNAVVHIVFFGDLNMEGEEETIGEFIGRCNLSWKTRHTVTKEKSIIAIEAVAMFDGDIIPNISHPTGKMSIIEQFPLECEDGTYIARGKSYRIFRITKERNPDGTVNFTRVEVTK